MRQGLARGGRWRGVLRVLIVLGAAATVGEAWWKGCSGREERFARVASMCEGVRERLGGIERVGFVCKAGAGDEGELKYYMAASMLAPVVVVRSGAERVVVAVYEGEGELQELARAGGLRVRERVGARVAILERGGR